MATQWGEANKFHKGLHLLHHPLFCILDDGKELVGLAEDSVESWTSEFVRGVPDELMQVPSSIGIDRVIYASTKSGLLKVPVRNDSFLSTHTVGCVMAHSVGENGWVGLSESGHLVNEHGHSLGSTAVGNSAEMVAGPAGIMVHSGEELGVVSEGEWTPWALKAQQELISIFWFADGQNSGWWGALSDGQGIRVAALSSESIGFQTQRAMGADSQPPIVSSDGLVYLVSNQRNTQVRCLRLSDGSLGKPSGRTPDIQLLCVVGVETPNGMRLAFAGNAGENGVAVIVNPETGASTFLELPKELNMTWTWAQWLVRKDTLILAAATSEITYIVTYR